jgi:uncharacterized protein
MEAIAASGLEAGTQVGIGLKPAHLGAVLAQAPVALSFFEVHAENYMVAGGPVLKRLQAVRERYALSIHGVGLSIGGVEPLNAAHLQRLATLAKRFEPQWFSEHLAWSSHAGRYLNDLLPLPYNPTTLQRVCDHIDQVQTVLGRRMLLENPATYLEFTQSTLDEGQFLQSVVARTGCGLLLDVNNVYVSAVNHGRDPLHLIDTLPAHAIGEIHLAGFAEDLDGVQQRLLIDTHGAPVSTPVWALYERALARLGPVPTLIERDNNVPPLQVLVDEAHRAEALLQRCQPAKAQT